MLCGADKHDKRAYLTSLIYKVFEGKIFVISPVEELQRVEREPRVFESQLLLHAR
ncbi:hypothetical protein HanIR_Chr02g0069591 [Helianthus annuus]|nr:hypothetical protein HanIR_Chr02g0069591 [Helianthus annuus]